MSVRTDVVLGIDIGTTSSKAVARPVPPRAMPQAGQRPQQAGPQTPHAEQRTPWHTGSRGQTETDAWRLLDVAVDLIGSTVQAAESAWGPVRVQSIGVTGLAESGVLLDAAARPAAPVIAWFDHRGDHELAQAGREFPAFAAMFERTTGLRWSSQASIAKLLWLRAGGYRPSDSSTWMSVPEWIVFALGGDRVREPSLASRTGLIDQGTGGVWPDALAVAGLPARILPDERPAGVRAGYLRHDGVTSCAAGAVLTVAGHDHPVAAIGVGAAGADELFNSTGTADVLARSIPGTLDETERQHVVSAGWSIGRHVLPDTSLLLAGASGGLLLRRVLAALGAESGPARAALDHAALGVGDLPAGLSVTGDGRTQDDVVIRIQDGACPASVWTAAVRHTAAQTRLLLDDIEKVVGPHRRAIAAGGWTQMASVRAAKAAAIDAMSFSAAPQPGVTGAALLASFALGGAGMPLADFILDQGTT